MVSVTSRGRTVGANRPAPTVDTRWPTGEGRSLSTLRDGHTECDHRTVSFV
ncbi:Hypothetical protein SCLAV_1761 [Streptomyces clavuligerus]|uniref:Uncharacterized protein n=1 Tax=Streptomyces clavuligerus TaxID=1901 RepID=E2Q3L5_STRCL|nr:Hypothetical protein SCLAV_1761 [Streptomyces clavuligerus]